MPNSAILPKTTPDPDAPLLGRELRSVMDELLAIEPSRLVVVNTDVSAAATLVIASSRELLCLRPELVAWFGEEMAAKVDRLELLARAVTQAQGRHAAGERPVDLQPLVAEVAELRAALLAELTSLAARKHLVASTLGSMRGGRGFKNIAFDVLQIVAFFTSHWSSIEHATGFSLAEIQHAEALASQLVTAVGLRDQPPRSAAADLRQRAFTLLSEVYDDVRRMVGFVRWKQGDADRIAPSWHRGRKRPRRGTNPRDAGDIDSTLPTSGQ